MNTLCFSAPPFPTYITGRAHCFKKGKKHIKRIFSVFDLLIVKSGVIYMSENGVNYDVKEGQYIILAPGLEHFSYKPCDTDTHYYWLHFDIDVHYELKEVDDINWGMIIKQEKTGIEAAKHVLHIPRYGTLINEKFIDSEITRLFSLDSTNKPEKRLKEQIIFQEILLQLQSDAIRIPTSAEQVTKQAVAYIQANYYKEMIKMDNLSKELLLHPDYITRCMQKTLGVTPMHYLTSYRLTKAKDFLSNTNEKLDSISRQIGILDSAYFTRVFKKNEGITPSEFRRLARREGK
ncbi:hypothetical protein BKP37_18375 [Anaerobacillus alkalilacustris]|uniref:HTH araC/xylS-type domain-containing protein n=2 Tax=Anaerobacillus alkalilacustris TaxID=393763 RepID=A0A1S2LDP3_9BACI|nr:hypothetical protein BKP37_18375 [Anaerobacillus alkalilacustris]